MTSIFIEENEQKKIMCFKLMDSYFELEKILNVTDLALDRISDHDTEIQVGYEYETIMQMVKDIKSATRKAEKEIKEIFSK